MDNSSYRSQYIQSGNENISEQSIAVYDAFWKRLEKAERSIGKSLEDGYTTEEYAILIGKMNVSNLNAFATYKSRVNRYIKWLNERGLIAQPYLDNLKNVTYDMIPSNHVYDTRYFKDFSSLQQSISDTIWVAERIDDRIFSTQITAIYLAWCGFSAEEAVAMKKAEGLALGMSGMLTGVSRLFAPLVALLTISTNGVLKLFGIDPTDEKEEVSEEEIYMMLEAGEEKGTIDAEETRWIRNVFAFDDISVEEICTHRVDMTVLGLEESDAEWQETILRSGYTYYPIYRENTDNIIGVLNTKVYFRLMEKNREAVMAQAVEKPYFVPEIMKADVLFRNMKQEEKLFAVVLDEYGGVSGVITLHDLLKLLVGDIYTDEKEIEQLGIHTYRMKGSTSLDDVAETLGISLPVKEYDTLGGYIFGVLGHIPEDGTTFALETDGMQIQVERVEGHRILDTVVRYEKTELQEAADEV